MCGKLHIKWFCSFLYMTILSDVECFAMDITGIYEMYENFLYQILLLASLSAIRAFLRQRRLLICNVILRKIDEFRKPVNYHPLIRYVTRLNRKDLEYHKFDDTINRFTFLQVTHKISQIGCPHKDCFLGKRWWVTNIFFSKQFEGQSVWMLRYCEHRVFL